MALLWQGSGIGMTSMTCMAPFLIIHMATEGVRVTLFVFIINNSLTKDFTKKTRSDVNDCSFLCTCVFLKNEIDILRVIACKEIKV